MRRLSAVILTCGCLAAATPAQAATTGEAQMKARQVASRQVSTYGIHYSPGDWAASCSRRAAGGFSCRVRTTVTNQCSGTLKLSGRLRAFALKVGCME